MIYFIPEIGPELSLSLNIECLNGMAALLPDPHHVEILRRGPRAWNAWRKQNPSELPRLMELTLSLSERQLGPISGGPIDLTSARLRNAVLRFATLSEAGLAGADLSNADLVHARLDGANLSAANLTGAVLDNADFADAKLSRTNLSGASLNDAQNLTQIWQLGTYPLQSEGDEAEVPSSIKSAEWRTVPVTSLRASRSNTMAEMFTRSPQSQLVIGLTAESSLATLTAKPPDEVFQHSLSLQERDAALAVPVQIFDSAQEIPLVKELPSMLTVTEIAALDPKISIGAELPPAAPSSAAIPPAKNMPIGTAALHSTDAATGSLRDVAVPPIPVRKPLTANLEVVPKPVRKPFIAKDYVEPTPAKKPVIQKHLVQPKVVKRPEEPLGPRPRPKGQSFVETKPAPSARRGSIADVLAGGL